MTAARTRPVLAVATLVLLAAGCARKPSAVTCASDAGCPSGTTCQHGVCQEGLALDLTAPAAATTYTSGGVPCEVAVRGATPAVVRLVVDDVTVQTLTPPFSGVLDTTGLGETAHTLVAEADSGGRTFRSPRRTIVVDRTRPAAPGVAPALTSALDPVTVSGTWSVGDTGAPVTLTVYEGAAARASGIVPSGGTWSGAFALAEGPHALTARATDAAGNASDLSPAAIVTVDRTAPDVHTRDPESAATNVWTRDPITVTFTEPMRPASVTDSTVILARGGGALLSKTLDLSADGLTLTITLPALPAVPDTLSLTLQGLTDRAGNALPSTSWSWDIPEWQDLGRPWGSAPRTSVVLVAIAVAPEGEPAVVAMSYAGPSNVSTISTRHTRAGWTEFPFPPIPWSPSSGSLTFTQAGDAVMAWSNASDSWATILTGGAWSTPQVLDVTPANATRRPVAAVDGTGTPYVAWIETVGLDRIFARRWSGASWTQLGTGALSSATVSASSPSVTSGGSPRVAWLEVDGAGTTARWAAWSGSDWGSSAGRFTDSQVGGAAATSAAGDWVGVVSTLAKAQLYQWVPGNVYISAHWSQATPDLNVTAAAADGLLIALDPASGNPVLAWNEATGGNRGFVKRYDAATSGWTELTKAAALPSIDRIAVGRAAGPAATGVVTAVRDESGGTNTILHFWRYNR